MEYHSGQMAELRRPNATAYPKSNGAALCDAPCETTLTRDQISSTEHWLNDLHGGLDRLEARLDTILTPIPPEVNGKGVGLTSTSPKSHVVGRLETLNDGFAHLMNRIERLKGRVEL